MVFSNGRIKDAGSMPRLHGVDVDMDGGIGEDLDRLGRAGFIYDFALKRLKTIHKNKKSSFASNDFFSHD